MKKKFAVIAALGCAFATGMPAAFAANYGMAGCGLGAMAFRDQPGTIQVVAATLNNLISPQTFAISSGTSNCVDGDSTDQASAFIQVNSVALRKDISRGQGETILSLAQILKCSDVTRLGQQLQKNYSNIYPSNTVSPQHVRESINTSIQHDETLAKSCAVLG